MQVTTLYQLSSQLTLGLIPAQTILPCLPPMNLFGGKVGKYSNVLICTVVGNLLEFFSLACLPFLAVQ